MLIDYSIQECMTSRYLLKIYWTFSLTVTKYIKFHTVDKPAFTDHIRGETGMFKINVTFNLKLYFSHLYFHKTEGLAQDNDSKKMEK